MNYQINSVKMIAQEFKNIKVRAADLFNDLSDEKFNYKPAPEKWSAAECLEHLNITQAGYLKNIFINGVSTAASEKKEGYYSPRYFLKKFARFTGPDSNIKMPSPKFLQATSSVLTKNTLTQFLKTQDGFLSVIGKINFESLKTQKVKWPAFPLIKLELGEVLIMTIAHQHRHLNQAERTLKNFTD